MNLDQAQRRIKYRKSYKHVDLIMKVYIAPKRDKDYQTFKDLFFSNDDKLELANGLSVDREFRLCAIWENGNGREIFDIPDIDKV